MERAPNWRRSSTCSRTTSITLHALARDRREWPSLMAVDEHLAQFSIRPRGTYFGGLYHQWIIFDDQWAGDNNHLAQSLLRYARRWDARSDPKPPGVS